MADLPARFAEALRDRYTLERELGRGGMATVYLAQDLRHDRPVALKVLLPELAASLGPERFQREIKLAARLQHPHILTVLDSGEAAGQLWFTMPYVEGQSLRDRLHREHQLPVEDALRITREAAAALDYAHEHGVVHRDVKPENILLTRRGEVLVADFGIARALGSSGAEALTQTGMAVGTPAYMSPEQAAGGPVDGRSDLYSLGCVLYEMLAGEVPYTGPTPQAIVAKRFSDPVPSVRRVRPTVPEAADQAIQRVLALVPADRFGTSLEFAQALQVPVVTPTATPTVATPAPAPPPVAPLAPPAPAVLEPTPARARRHIPVAAITLGLGFLIGLGVLFAWRRSHGGASERVGPKVLAVLPFENLGDSADAYFADGVTDEVRAKLATIGGLQVIARGSSTEYRHSTKRPQEIARELGADYLLTATVRWEKGSGGSASRVRVSPELVDVSPGHAPSTRWGEPFDAALTDVFQVQADIAGKVARALNVALGADVPQTLAARPTTSTEAYDDYLRAKEYWERQSIPDVRLAVQLYHQAVALDSTFALAWAWLAIADAYLYWYRADHSAEQLGRVEQAARRSLALAPDLPDAHVAMGYYHYWGHRDYTQALEEFGTAAKREPNNAEVAAAIGFILRRQGKWDQAVASIKRATELDPRSYGDLEELGNTYLMIRVYPEAERALNRAIALGPDLPQAYGVLMRLYLNWEGSLDKPRRVLQQALSRMDFGRAIGGVAGASTRDLVAADDAYQADVARLTPAPFLGDTLSYFEFKASVYRYRGERAKARAYDDSTRAEALAIIARHEDDVFTHATLAVADAYLGRGTEAIQAGQQAVAMLPLSKDAVYGFAGPQTLAEVYTVLGDTNAALDQLEALLAVPSPLSGARLRADPTWAPLRGNPRFERLVAGK
ncbi:MAG TPA: protein kinase [Gemmatimonadales bacterium]|nr:protein kinase [Gemmatimonadales bacterium]